MSTEVTRLIVREDEGQIQVRLHLRDQPLATRRPPVVLGKSAANPRGPHHERAYLAGAAGATGGIERQPKPAVRASRWP